MPPKARADARSIAELKARAEADRAGSRYLLFRDRAGVEQTVCLSPEVSQVTIGRTRSCDLLFEWDAQVSRLHARLERVGEDWELVDNESRNGTFVNEQRVSDRHRLNDGDVVRFGATSVTFRSPKPHPAAAGGPKANSTGEAVVLSTTQRRVLLALCCSYKRAGSGKPASDEQIAEELFISVGAVRSHLMVLSAKLGVGQAPGTDSRVQLIERTFAAGLVSERDL